MLFYVPSAQSLTSTVTLYIVLFLHTICFKKPLYHFTLFLSFSLKYLPIQIIDFHFMWKSVQIMDFRFTWKSVQITDFHFTWKSV